MTEARELPAAATTAEVASVLRTTPAGVRRLIREGQLRAIAIGRRLLIPRAEVLRLLGGGRLERWQPRAWSSPAPRRPDDGGPAVTSPPGARHRGSYGIVPVALMRHPVATARHIAVYASLASVVDFRSGQGPARYRRISQMASQRFLPPNAIVMHPRRWAWFLAALDSQQRPLVVPVGDGLMNAAGVGLGMSEEGPVGRLHGLPVFIDANIPTNLGGGTNEDRIVLLRGEDHTLFESEIRTRVLPEVGSGTLTVRLQVYNYAAFTAGRYPTSVAVISGTGLVAPVF
ncbi:MAG: helix-turn-helix domain-containing protein [Actinomycetota bacterium]